MGVPLTPDPSPRSGVESALLYRARGEGGAAAAPRFFSDTAFQSVSTQLCRNRPDRGVVGTPSATLSRRRSNLSNLSDTHQPETGSLLSNRRILDRTNRLHRSPSIQNTVPPSGRWVFREASPRTSSTGRSPRFRRSPAETRRNPKASRRSSDAPPLGRVRETRHPVDKLVFVEAC